MGLSEERTLTTLPCLLSVTTLQAMSQVAQIVRLTVTPSLAGRSLCLALAIALGSKGTGAGMALSKSKYSCDFIGQSKNWTHRLKLVQKMDFVYTLWRTTQKYAELLEAN
jgi:hypothetical protein